MGRHIFRVGPNVREMRQHTVRVSCRERRPQFQRDRVPDPDDDTGRIQRQGGLPKERANVAGIVDTRELSTDLRDGREIRLGSDRLRSVVADLSEESSIKSLFVAESRVDHVFVPAGELRPGGGDLLKSDLDGLRSILEVRLLGVTHVVRQAWPKMKAGSITLMSGLYSTRPAPGGGMAAAAVAAPVASVNRNKSTDFIGRWSIT